MTDLVCSQEHFDIIILFKYLGLNSFAVYDGVKTAQSNAIMAKSKS